MGDKALEAKNKGNASFASGDFQTAIVHFTEAIQLDPSNQVLYSNRSASYASLQKYDEALADAEKTVELKPDWSRGWGRKGAALHGKRDYEEALIAYKKGLQIEPNSAALQKGLDDAEEAMFSSGAPGGGQGNIGNMFKGDVLSKLRANPQTAAYCSQPDFIAHITRLQQDPKHLNTCLQDPRIMAAVGVLLGVNVQTPESAGFGRGNEDEEARSPPPPKKEEPKKSEPAPPVEVPEHKKQALAEKDKGTEAYKKREFETALQHYSRAIEMDPEDITYLTNRSAVYFEMKNYDQCIADCKQAIEKGREVRADFKLVGRAFQRLGNAYAKQEKYTEAIEAYNKSLTENRTAEVLETLRRTERLKKDKEERDYLNPELSRVAKEAGGEHFKKGEFPDAIKQYTEAVRRNPDDHTLYTNRALCYTRLGEYPLALKDADKAIELKPDFGKAYIRKGLCHFFMKEYDKALEAYDRGMKIPGEENNAEMVDGMQKTMQAIQRRNYGGDQPEGKTAEDRERSEAEEKQRRAKAMSDPEIQAILRDPIMNQVLQDLSSDPRAAQTHMRNPGVAAKINKLIASGVLKMG